MTTESNTDKFLRDETNSRRPSIDTVLKQLEYERNSLVLDRECLFCKQRFKGNRSILLDHLIEFHHFRVGHPDNIVFIEEFLRVLDDDLAALRCIYCQREFPDWPTMKEHMRKKGHKEIPMHCAKYDRFYVVNYVAGTCGSTHAEEVVNEEAATGGEFEDWREVMPLTVQCLFCEFQAAQINVIEKHMADEHRFKLDVLIVSRGQIVLTCYDRIRIVNFIRSMTNQQRCYICQLTVNSNAKLIEHLCLHDGELDLEQSRSQWSQDLYLTPVIQGDALLCHVLNGIDDDSETGASDVIAEELTNQEPDPAILQQLISEASPDTTPSPPPS